ncbi:hypothetical protein, partial [Acinetobacter johnsonii]|uniref:hypothetical protein n=1 Tax=Acinetobacter johnsonii TaxID=40214 RepID=UPI001F19D375
PRGAAPAQSGGARNFNDILSGSVGYRRFGNIVVYRIFVRGPSLGASNEKCAHNSPRPYLHVATDALTFQSVA